jgi:ATP-binding cassette subfamily B protein
MYSLPRKRIKFLFKLISRHKYCFALLFILTVFLGAGSPFIIWSGGHFIEHLQEKSADVYLVKSYAQSAALVLLLAVLIHNGKNLILAYFKPNLNRSCRRLCFGQIFSNSYLFFKKNQSILITKSVSDLANASIKFIDRIIYLLAIACSFISIVTIVSLIDKYLAFMFLFWIIISLFSYYFFARMIANLDMQAQISNANFNHSAVDAISNYIDSRLANNLDYEDNLLRERSLEILMIEEKIGFFVAYIKLTCILITLVFIAAMSSYCYTLLNNHKIPFYDISFLMILGVYMYYTTFKCLNSVIDSFAQFQIIKSNLKFLTYYHSKEDKRSNKDLIIKGGKIEFKKVSLRYQQNENSFKDKTLTIEPGQKVALVGLSGSGKTSFSYTIPRLIKVTSGKIFIDGQDISKVSLASLNKCIAILKHEPLLFKRSIKDNITYGCQSFDDDAIINASIKASCHDFIMNLEKGYDTIVGERGGKLTQGQKYRILIARAILKDPAIIILDEPDFDLDAISTKHIKEALSYLFANKTVIIIAHWLQTLKKADRILVFEMGTIVEDGTHQELLRYDEVYASLWHMQDGGYLPATFDK